jgi:hypothetical protein
MQKNLEQLTARLEKALSDSLVSVILYGSAASGEFHQPYSDINVLCVLRTIGPAELAAVDPVFRWWCDLGNPMPMLLTEAEVQSSTDCFPIEFHDMRDKRRVLFGADVIASLEIDHSFYRAQVEYQLRTAFLRLRQKSAAVLHDKKLLGKLLTESVTTFLVLGRHALMLAGAAPEYNKRVTIQVLAERFGIDPAPFSTLMDLREERSGARQVDISAVFAQYLISVRALVDAVDQLEK